MRSLARRQERRSGCWTDPRLPITTIPGIGALNATALVEAIGDVATFHRGRNLAA